MITSLIPAFPRRGAIVTQSPKWRTRHHALHRLITKRNMSAVTLYDHFLLLPFSFFLALLSAQEREKGLIGHWKLAGDVRDYSGNDLHGLNQGADLTAAGPDAVKSGAARFVSLQNEYNMLKRDDEPLD